MQLKDEFYQIISCRDEQEKRQLTLQLQPEHPIYQAHFPGNPVTPGACLIRIIHELTEEWLVQPLYLKTIINTKFLHVVDPLLHESITCRLQRATTEQGATKITAVIEDETRLFAKMSLLFEPKLPPLGKELDAVPSRASGTVLHDRQLEAVPSRASGTVLHDRQLEAVPSRALGTMLLGEQLEEMKIGVIIPVYNNEQTIGPLLDELLTITPRVIVVDDGSTDRTATQLHDYRDRLTLITQATNRGKGLALQRGMEEARALGWEHAVTMDADGQHRVSDLGRFVERCREVPGALIVGCRNLRQENMPQKNSFANRFSNFWFAVQTGRCLADTQTGYRLYPLQAMRRMRLFSSRYEAELEWLVRAAWRAIPLESVPVEVYYAPAHERVSHFRPTVDFLRISLLNTVLCLLALVYGYPSILFHRLLNRKHR